MEVVKITLHIKEAWGFIYAINLDPPKYKKNNSKTLLLSKKKKKKKIASANVNIFFFFWETANISIE